MREHITITVEIPTDALELSHESPEQARALLQELWLLDHVRSGHLSIGKVAKILGKPIADVMELMASHGIPYPSYSAEDLRREVGPI